MFKIVRTKTLKQGRVDAAYSNAIKMLLDGWVLSPMAAEPFKEIEEGVAEALADFEAVKNLQTQLHLCQMSQSALLNHRDYHKKISKGRLAKIKKLEAYIEQLKEATP